MTTADVSLVAKESIDLEKFKNYMPAQFFCPILYVRFLRGTDIWVGGSNICIPI